MYIDQAIKSFSDYVATYFVDKKKYIVKKNHTIRVMQLCGKIGHNLNLSQEDIELSQLCGLLHDIARFEQIKRYDTFSDLISIDHGDFGVELLLENNLIRKFNPQKENDSIILSCVKHHNKAVLPDDLNERELLFLKIVKDADKLDILHIVTTDEWEYEIDKERISDEVYESILNNSVVYSKDTKTKIDWICLWCAFVFDFHFDISLKTLYTNNYISILIKKYIDKSDNEETKKKLEKIKNHIQDYFKKKEGITC